MFSFHHESSFHVYLLYSCPTTSVVQSMSGNNETPFHFDGYTDDEDDDDDDNDNDNEELFADYEPAESGDINNPHLLEMVMEVRDDFFVGRSSKTIFTRHPSCIDVRLDYEVELLWLQRHKAIPRLRELCSNNDGNSRFFFWLAVELEFEKPEDSQERCTR